MKYLKSFIESADPLASLKSCFDGFEEFGAKIYSNIKRTYVEIVWDEGYEVDHDILDELESSLGKSKEIGFKFYSGYIDGYTDGELSKNRLLKGTTFREFEDLTKIIGTKTELIVVYFDNRYYQNVDESIAESDLDGDIINCFDHLENIRVVKMVRSSSFISQVRLINREDNWYKGYTTDENLIEDIISSIGMASELGFRFLKIRFVSSTGGKDIEISKLEFLENPIGRLRKIRKFAVGSIIIDFRVPKVNENINQHNVGKYDTELKHCFDGFEELNLHVQELTDKRGTILISRRHEKFTAVPFVIDDNIADELESAIGKSGEIGYSLIRIHPTTSMLIDRISYRTNNIDKIKNLIGVRVHNILVYFNKPINESKNIQPSLKNVFDHISDRGVRVIENDILISNYVIKRDRPNIQDDKLYLDTSRSKVNIITISERDPEILKNGVRWELMSKEDMQITFNLIDDIESAIGMAEEIGYLLLKIQLNFSDISLLHRQVIKGIKEMEKFEGEGVNTINICFFKTT